MIIKRKNPSGRLVTVGLGSPRNIGVRGLSEHNYITFHLDGLNSAMGISFQIEISEAELDVLYMRVKELAKVA